MEYLLKNQANFISFYHPQKWSKRMSVRETVKIRMVKIHSLLFDCDKGTGWNIHFNLVGGCVKHLRGTPVQPSPSTYSGCKHVLLGMLPFILIRSLVFILILHFYYPKALQNNHFLNILIEINKYKLLNKTKILNIIDSLHILF